MVHLHRALPAAEQRRPHGFEMMDSDLGSPAPRRIAHSRQMASPSSEHHRQPAPAIGAWTGLPGSMHPRSAVVETKACCLPARSSVQARQECPHFLRALAPTAAPLTVSRSKHQPTVQANRECRHWRAVVPKSGANRGPLAIARTRAHQRSHFASPDTAIGFPAKAGEYAGMTCLFMMSPKVVPSGFSRGQANLSARQE